MYSKEHNRAYQSRVDKDRNSLLKKYDPNSDVFNIHEYNFMNLLDNESIFYIRERKGYTINDAQERRYYMDFYIPYYKIDIEIDGRHHGYSAKQKGIDETKTKYLKTEKKIQTARIWNHDVEEMTKANRIDWNLVFQKIPKGYIESIDDEFRRKEKQLTSNYANFNIKADKEIFFYNTENGVHYKYDNVLELHRAIGLKTKDIVSYIERVPKSSKLKYIFSFSKERLEELIQTWKQLKNKSKI